MRRLAIAMIMIGAATAWGQTPKPAAAAPVKIDRAAAYYHFMLAHMYSELADASISKRALIEYESKVIENYNAAVKADPQTPNPRELTAPFTQIYIPPPPESRQTQPRR